MEIFWTLIVLGAVGWAVFTQVQGRKQVDVVAPLSEQDAAQVVLDHFGALWKQVDGPGHLNFRPKLRMHPPTLAVSFTPNGTNQCEVSTWLAFYTTRYGIMWHGQLAWRKKAMLGRKLGASAASTEKWARGA